MTHGSAALPDDAEVQVAGETLTLLPERGVHWTRTATLLIADPHWGKAAAFRAGGFPVPHGTTASGLQRLDAMLARTAARRIVFLGDYLHARASRHPDTLWELEQWRSTHRRCELILVPGNHDRHAGDPPPALGVTTVNAPLEMAPFVLTHHPVASPSGYVLSGHLHPGALLMGPGRQRERLPCFWFGRHTAVLPAFGDFTGLALVEPAPADRVLVIAGNCVVDVSRGAPR